MKKSRKTVFLLTLITITLYRVPSSQLSFVRQITMYNLIVASTEISGLFDHFNIRSTHYTREIVVILKEMR